MYRQDSPLAFDDDASSWYLEQTPAGSKDLCDRCEEVLARAASDSTCKASVHHRCAGSFFKAADASCLICSYLCAKIPWKAEFFPDEILEAVVPGAPFSTYSVHRTRLEIRLEWVGESYDPGKGLIWIPQIKSWLDECDGQHSTCRSLNRSPGYIPTRLLDLGSPDDPYVRLVESHECLAPCRYVTLSHCWGATRMDGPLRLLQANYATMRAGIANLPRTFLEAVQVARHLQVRYLWIDSLCIIQDSPHDWQTEVSRMGQIYGASHCNIAAAGSRNTAAGLYLEQNPRLQPPWRLYLRDAHSQAAKLMELSAPSAPIGDEFAAAALTSRAWALQERLLAPRTLHFGRQRIYWDCGHCFTWEGSSAPRTADQLSSSSYRPSWVTPLTDAKMSLASLLYQSRQHTALAVQPPHDDGKVISPAGSNDDGPNASMVAMIHAQWTAIVAHYTTLSLAKRTDKLHAMTGLAQLFQSLLDASSAPSPSPSSSSSPLSSSPSSTTNAVLHVHGKLERSFWRHTAGMERPHHLAGHRRASSSSGASTSGRRRRWDFVHVEQGGGIKRQRRTELRVDMDADVEASGGGGSGYGSGSDDDDDDAGGGGGGGGGFGDKMFLALVAYRVRDDACSPMRRDARVVEGLVVERAYTSRVRDSWQRVGVFACEYAGVVADPFGAPAGWGGIGGVVQSGGGGAVAAVSKEEDVGKGSAEELYRNFLALPDKSVRLV
ncbi:hypothetical protein SLS55_002893 [Diplodia seriata]|uniref:Heterokaryon incompatibility domain-containing protein n=1 Tax=Diplodia seriata TaxID=420778 RepID=A0ABR3CLF4_9PEZI